jgi:hypothetical protein
LDVLPEGITPDNADLWDSYIKRKSLEKKREGVWFMNSRFLHV